MFNWHQLGEKQGWCTLGGGVKWEFSLLFFFQCKHWNSIAEWFSLLVLALNRCRFSLFFSLSPSFTRSFNSLWEFYRNPFDECWLKYRKVYIKSQKFVDLFTNFWIFLNFELFVNMLFLSLPLTVCLCLCQIFFSFVIIGSLVFKETSNDIKHKFKLKILKTDQNTILCILKSKYSRLLNVKNPEPSHQHHEICYDFELNSQLTNF